MNLTTDYLGLKLANPLVPSASPLSKDADSVRRLEDAGASAIVMYSLFEEEVRAEDQFMDAFLYNQDIGHSEADSYRPVSVDYQTRTDEYLAHIFSLKQFVDMPIIASLNGVTTGGWIEHALELQEAGADALELNVYHVAADITQSGQDIEQMYLDVLVALRSQVKMPLIMKLSPYFSSVANMVTRLEEAGVDGVSLFNRFYQPSIDIETRAVSPELNLSTSPESLLAMRWIAILSGKVNITLAATGGVHTADDVIRLLMAGADVTHMCSALLLNGPEYLGEVLTEVSNWLEENEYESISQLKGCTSQQHALDPVAYERSNYMQVLNSYKP
jgi:dihydroorotate dehydrogenase (fumarate)